MDNDFLKRLTEFYSICTLGLYVNKKIDFKNYSILYSQNVKDFFYNFAFNIITICN